MLKNSRSKGNRNVRHCRDYFETLGFITDTVEKTSKFATVKDLFGLFDVIALKKGSVIFIQVKSNNPPTRQPYIDFATKYATIDGVSIMSYTWYDNEGPVILDYLVSGKIIKKDLRKSSVEKFK